MEPSALGSWSKRQIAEQIGVDGAPESRNFHIYQASLQVKCVEDIEAALRDMTDAQKKASASQDKLSARVFWLNLALLLATAIGAVATGVQAWVVFHQKSPVQQISNSSELGGVAATPTSRN